MSNNTYKHSHGDVTLTMTVDAERFTEVTQKVDLPIHVEWAGGERSTLRVRSYAANWGDDETVNVHVLPKRSPLEGERSRFAGRQFDHCHVFSTNTPKAMEYLLGIVAESFHNANKEA